MHILLVTPPTLKLMCVQRLSRCVALIRLLRRHGHTAITGWLDGDGLAVHEASVGSAVLVGEVEGVAGEVGAASGLAGYEVGIV